MSSMTKRLAVVLIGVVGIGFMVAGCGKLALPSSPRTGVESIRFLRYPDNTLGPSYVEKMIKAKKGGCVELNMYSLKIPKKALSNDTKISICGSWPGIVAVDFGPEGLQFNDAVELKISYKSLDLGDIKPKDLTIYFVDYASNTWIDTNSKVDTKKKTVTAWIDHFSRYALSDH